MKQLPDPMTWLHDGVPLTLLIDLFSEEGPASREIFLHEPADLAWTGAPSAA